MDLTNLGFDVTTIAAIIGICLSIRLYALNIIKKDKENKFALFIDSNILLIVVTFGIIAGVGLSFKDLETNIFKNIYIIFKNCIVYSGGSVLFHQIYKQFLEKKEE
jgi:hypothetical protein